MSWVRTMCVAEIVAVVVTSMQNGLRRIIERTKLKNSLLEQHNLPLEMIFSFENSNFPLLRGAIIPTLLRAHTNRFQFLSDIHTTTYSPRCHILSTYFSALPFLRAHTNRFQFLSDIHIPTSPRCHFFALIQIDSNSCRTSSY